MTAEETEGLTDRAVPLTSVRLVVPSEDSSAELARGTLTLGTGPLADLKLKDRSVSRVHATFELLRGAVRVRDAGSRNGTFFLGARVETATVPIGASVKLGRCEVRIVASAAELAEVTADAPSPLVGNSAPMRRLFGKLERLARSEAALLIEGPSGCGKEALARAIHMRSRPASPFVVVDCGGIAPNLLEAELFGVAKGAFTGADRARAGLLERALDGTLLIDEPAALPLELQPKLLRALESREFHRIGEGLGRRVLARFITVSQAPLEALVAEGRFRQDLFYRLSALRLEVPGLAKRREDIPLLAQSFAAARGTSLPPSTLAAMQCHDWPGNVRELKSATERALLQLGESTPAPAQAAPSFLDARERLLTEFEREYVSTLLSRHQGNVSAAAREAKLARSFFYTLLKKYQLG